MVTWIGSPVRLSAMRWPAARAWMLVMPGTTSYSKTHVAPGQDVLDDSQRAVVERRVAPDQEGAVAVVVEVVEHRLLEEHGPAQPPVVDRLLVRLGTAVARWVLDLDDPVDAGDVARRRSPRAPATRLALASPLSTRKTTSISLRTRTACMVTYSGLPAPMPTRLILRIGLFCSSAAGADPGWDGRGPFVRRSPCRPGHRADLPGGGCDDSLAAAGRGAGRRVRRRRPGSRPCSTRGSPMSWSTRPTRSRRRSPPRPRRSSTACWSCSGLQWVAAAGDDWTSFASVGDCADAVRDLPDSCVFLTTGRRDLAALCHRRRPRLPRAQHRPAIRPAAAAVHRPARPRPVHRRWRARADDLVRRGCAGVQEQWRLDDLSQAGRRPSARPAGLHGRAAAAARGLVAVPDVGAALAFLDAPAGMMGRCTVFSR